MEKNEISASAAPAPSQDSDLENGEKLSIGSRLKQWNTRIESLSGFEQGGITRILPEQRHPSSVKGDIQMLLLWLSANVSINNLAVGLLGPLLFGLGFLDSSLCAVFGASLGAVSTAYMSIWGPQSGCRTMVRAVQRVEAISILTLIERLSVAFSWDIIPRKSARYSISF